MLPLPPENPSCIVVATLNARFIHASLGLRYLLANMGELRPLTVMREFTVVSALDDVVDALLAVLGEETGAVQIVGLGVYVWNVEATLAVLRRLRVRRPAVRVVLGGPEVSHEAEAQTIVALADYVIAGWGELSFAALCRSLLAGEEPAAKFIAGQMPPLTQIALPYAEYSADDLAQRVVYVEASRGCPYTCEFCLSALDRGAWSFDLPRLLAALDTLHRRGARNFKFVDRTFNVRIADAVAILQFFIDRLPAPGAASERLLLHFEVVPDRLPERLKALIARFPPGVLQLEVGVQTFNGEVQKLISRRQDDARSEANLRWLVGSSRAHVHADLIFGLPGETLASFARGFDRLVAIGPNEIQVGLLKRLRGAPIARHSAAYALVFDPAPPYTVLQTDAVSADEVRRVARFARYWEIVANSGRFARTLALLLATRDNAATGAPSAFASFSACADWLWQRSGRTNGWSPEALVDALFDYLCGPCALPAEEVRRALLADYLGSAARGSPHALAGLLPRREAPRQHRNARANRQQQHLASLGEGEGQ